jgi:hypothetical protein
MASDLAVERGSVHLVCSVSPNERGVAALPYYAQQSGLLGRPSGKLATNFEMPTMAALHV